MKGGGKKHWPREPNYLTKSFAEVSDAHNYAEGSEKNDYAEGFGANDYLFNLHSIIDLLAGYDQPIKEKSLNTPDADTLFVIIILQTLIPFL